jgi:hypothetical protein
MNYYYLELNNEYNINFIKDYINYQEYLINQYYPNYINSENPTTKIELFFEAYEKFAECFRYKHKNNLNHGIFILYKDYPYVQNILMIVNVFHYRVSLTPVNSFGVISNNLFDYYIQTNIGIHKSLMYINDPNYKNLSISFHVNSMMYVKDKFYKNTEGIFIFNPTIAMENIFKNTFSNIPLYEVFLEGKENEPEINLNYDDKTILTLEQKVKNDFEEDCLSGSIGAFIGDII